VPHQTVRPSGCPIEIVAHRGASIEAPENTLASVELAWQIGADAVEIDVQLSRDGHLAVAASLSS
jgi:glycerophosphoryl diester phosphodiesterase